MNLLIVAALVAVCGAAKLDRTYLPPASAKTAGGSPGALQAPNSFSQNSAPKGSYTNEFQGVVVDAALAGTRASGSEETGLGGPRNSYGSTASKVGDAAFRGAQAGFRFPTSSPDFGSANSQFGLSQDSQDHVSVGEPREIPEQSQDFGASRDSVQGFGASDSRPERPQAAQERAASTLRFDSEVGVESFNYAFETDNGISAEETGVATNGVQAQGAYSYTGDDGKVYSVTYTADEGGYQPRGDHLPTPPPIPEEILKSLEQNARDEANGVIDDGSYDAQKYNAGVDYAESDSANGKQNGRPSVNTGNTDVDASNSFINQNNQPFNPSNPRQRGDDNVNQFQAPHGNNGGFQSNAASGNRFGTRNEYLPPFQQSRPQSSRPQIPTANAENSDVESSSTFQQESTEHGSGDFQSRPQQNQQTSTRPATQSFGSRPSSNNQFNSFKQSSSNGNQFNQNGNRFPSSQGNRQQFGAAPMTSGFGHSQFSAQTSGSLNSQHATSIPDTELTTPFESSSPDAQPSAPTSTNNLGFNAQPTQNGQSHSGFGSQSSRHQASQAPIQPTIPSFTHSRPQGSNNRPFGGNRNTQSTLSTQAPQVPEQQEQFSQQSQFSNKRPQLSQNRFSQNADNQFAPSTQRPQFASQANTQDDSYYYNQPSRTFNTPQTQGSRFSSAASNQFDRVTQRPSFSSQTTQYPEEQNYPSTPFPSQNGQRQGSSKYPTPPSFPTESAQSDTNFQSNAVASTTNGITQASASSFAAPTSATGFNRQQFGQSKQQFQQPPFQSKRPTLPEPSKPSFGAQTTAQPQASRGQSQFEKQNFESAQPLSQQPLQDVKQPTLDDDTKPDVLVTNQQYNGEIYEYTKPAEMLPPPENGFGQFGQKVQSTQQPAQSRPQFGQTPTSPTQQSTASSAQFGQSKVQNTQFKPRPQFSQSSTSQTQQSASFSSKPQFNQIGKAPQGDQFGAQTASQITTDVQFDAKPTRQQFGQSVQAEQQSSNQFNGQRRPFDKSQGNFAGSTAETPKPFEQNGRNCCKDQLSQTQTSFGQAGRPSQFGGESSFSSSSFQSTSGFKPDQSQSVAGKGEVFGGPRAPPSFDETGYHY